MAIPALFCFPLSWNTFHHPFTLSIGMTLKLKWVSCRQLCSWVLFFYPSIHSIPFAGELSSVTQSCMILWHSMNYSIPGFLVHQHLMLAQTHVHRVSDTIQPSHPLLSPSPPAPNPSQHQSFFQALLPKKKKLVEVMEFQLNYFKSKKMMLLKCCTQYAIKFGKLSSGHRTEKGQF